MTNISYHISNLLEKMTSTDKDFRFMATNDLMMELQKDSIKLDEDSEKKVVKMLLKLLEDKNGEVQNLAVKCLGPLVSKVKEYQVETIVDTLCTNMLSDKEQLRDISSIGLKTVISELPPPSTGSTMTANVCKKITAQLTGAIGKQEDVSVQLEALDILSDILSRLGGTLYSFHSSILNCLLPQLISPRLAVRKRAIIALGHLVLTCNGNIFAELMEHLLSELKRNNSTSTTRTYIQCIAGISKQAGHRIGDYLEKMIPLIIQYCNVEDDELREYCFQAFESFVRRCPKEIGPHLPNVTGLCLKYITYDPNYNYDNEEEDEDEMMETENGEDEEQESDDEYSDDDDISWKVRRSAAKCLEAIVSTRHDLLQDFYKTLSPALISRFKEREENVKADIFSAYISLLKQTLPIQSWLQASDEAGKEDIPLTMLQNQVPNIIKALHKQLKEKSVRSRQGCFALLTELANVLPGCLADHIPALVPGIVFSLTDKSSSSNMKIDTLTFLHVVLCNHPQEVFHPHVKTLLPPVVICIGDPFYKITSEALLVTLQLVKVIRPLDAPCTFDAKPYVTDLFSATLKRLKAADIDQEVKERAISCMGQIVSNLGDYLSSELQPTLKIFLERLKNEITRLTTVKALTLIANSSLKIDLRPILAEGFPILASFLRKNQRALKLSTLTALDVLIRNYSDSLKPAMIECVLMELPDLISENDMHVSQVAIVFLTTLAKVYPSSLSKISGTVLSELFQLVYSPLMQGGALNAIVDFFQALVVIKAVNMSYADLMKQLTSPIYSSTSSGVSTTLHKQAFHSVAKCVTALSSVCPKEIPGLVNLFIQDVKNPKSTTAVRMLAFLSLAEIGRTTNLSTQKELKAVILDAFASPSEEVKSAASYALGNISVGNLKEYLPFMLKEIGGQPKRQYLLLHSLKEVISSSPAESLKPYGEDIWALLFKHCEYTEEGTRNVVAECLGKLTVVNPSQLLPRLKKQLFSGSPYARSTVVTAIKFTISDHPQPIDPLLKGCIGDFLKTLQDPDLNVRRVALAMFNSAAHNKPSLIRDQLSTVLPHLYNETKIRRELIREVEMGPFKHTVDDGLDVRKAAFECMYTLLESCLDRLDIYEYLNHVEDGLKDHYDIRMLTFIMLARLSTLCPNAVLQRLERLVEPLRATCSTKVKAGSVKQEFEKQDELKRSAMRAVAALLTIPDADKSPVMAEFSSQIRANPEMSSLFESIQKDPTSLSASDSMDLS
ncbi:cullin-associated NEDD8-dissociated protein 1-like [Ahaetulla prasina]|uniref:cullin-associated NEDD8-dissociated protein 1-like n=1 Tax=Ahaetulla prasina TaxID=499056 RepID=UPI00264A05F1|nr:cullin-associated NEDD8-dissociated protein 1-like [Ahaetulla prasina]XP_058025285.1 cullin-associated NEDD8-dissociated protein 1-like [Ahaetulla prasina]XP_058025286.1 cullin-associated NEDD8-dissociated protein 1-like [Ahaetulla prasina]